MKVAVIKEVKNREKRVALVPESVGQLVKLGFEIEIEKGAGLNANYTDEDYSLKGATIASSVDSMLSGADLVLAVNAPEIDTIAKFKKGATLISFVYPHTKEGLLSALEKNGCSVFAMEAIPRISRAQKMDALSSQSNLAGYKAVIMGANALGKIFPMLMTAAGTIKPSKVVIMGAGVAGLQAIATAKRLGAIVEVSDIRPETKEQVESLGGKFIEVKGDDSIKTEGGYVKGVSEEFLQKQQALITKHISEADLVITTALIPGRKAPVLITEEMVKKMKRGSVIVDMAAEQGGNCALCVFNETVDVNGVTILGESNLPSLLPMNASDLYSKNIQTFLLHLATKDGFNWDMADEITTGSVLLRDGVSPLQKA